MLLNESRALALDYMPCSYGNSKLVFRGPKRDLPQDYVLFIGGGETFGRFVARPFPALFEAQTGVASINLAACNAGLDSFRQDATVIAMARNARLVVVQAMGAQFLSNRYYSVHPRRNDRFIKATLPLRRAYPTVDFTDIAFVGHLLDRLEDESAQRFEQVQREFRRVWVLRMQSVLKLISRPSVVLWINQTVQFHPDFLSLDLLEKATQGRAQILAVSAPVDAGNYSGSGMVFTPAEMQAAALALTPERHAKIADDLSLLL